MITYYRTVKTFVSDTFCHFVSFAADTFCRFVSFVTDTAKVLLILDMCKYNIHNHSILLQNTIAKRLPSRIYGLVTMRNHYFASTPVRV